MAVFDILVDEKHELPIKNGDFVIGQSDEQHMKDILLANKGNYLFSAFTGVGLEDFIDDETDASDLKNEIERQYELDGITIERLTVTQNSVDAKGEYL